MKGGRCEACSGDGVVQGRDALPRRRVRPLRGLPGKRYNAQTLAVRYKGKNIADVLDTSVDECLELFSRYPPLTRILGRCRTSASAT